LQHYQDPERVDLGVAMQGVVDQLVQWLSGSPAARRPAHTAPAKGERASRRSV